jgi:hypothetical protein
MVELSDRAHEADVAFLDQVEQRQPAMEVAARDPYDEAEIRLHEALARARGGSLDGVEPREQHRAPRQGRPHFGSDAIDVLGCDAQPADGPLELGLEPAAAGDHRRGLRAGRARMRARHRVQLLREPHHPAHLHEERTAEPRRITRRFVEARVVATHLGRADRAAAHAVGQRLQHAQSER